MTDSADAIFVHGYWLSQKGNEDTTLSLRSTLVTQAAAKIFQQQNKYPFIVLAAGHIWGESYPSVGALMQQQLILSGIPKEKIILQDTAINTKDEIDILLQLRQQQGWQQILDIAFQKHLWTIPLLFGKEKQRVQFISVEKVLGRIHIPFILEWNYLLYQLTVRLVLFFDPTYTFLGKKSHADRRKKSGFGLLSFLPADKYEL